MFPVGRVLVFKLVNRARVKCGHGSQVLEFYFEQGGRINSHQSSKTIP